MKTYELAIFDCDGVLFDSREANRAYYNRILEYFGRDPLDKSELSFVHMHTAEESVTFLFREYPDILPDALNYARKLDYIQFIEYMTMEPGVSDTLEELRPYMKTAISTNRSTTMKRLREIFGLDKWFDIIVCALDVERPKPDPEGVFKILNNLEVHREKAIYIGDSKVDEEVAKRSGLDLIAYKNPDLDARFHVKHFLEIKDILKK